MKYTSFVIWLYPIPGSVSLIFSSIKEYPRGSAHKDDQCVHTDENLRESVFEDLLTLLLALTSRHIFADIYRELWRKIFVKQWDSVLKNKARKRTTTSNSACNSRVRHNVCQNPAAHKTRVRTGFKKEQQGLQSDARSKEMSQHNTASQQYGELCISPQCQQRRSTHHNYSKLSLGLQFNQQLHRKAYLSIPKLNDLCHRRAVATETNKTQWRGAMTNNPEMRCRTQ